ncbi:39S ribosomal protein L47, mitochondrial [Protopterus annectens]|uniref:39S ribosomal protein L47, mitochondrial n=1 Tax=Protopterus annectens TaxID=7888 RepID=UPI001CFC32BC|nr:39S ribosomal protein L47, mitochondrial [Protopterus annectens]
MAATLAGRVLFLCKQFSNVLRLDCVVSEHVCKQAYGRIQPTAFRSDISQGKKSNLNTLSGLQCRDFHTGTSHNGLEEFFDDPKNWGETTVKSGAPWTAKLLRTKSNEDLHKLWYVLLKEMNMLLTLQQEAKRQRLPMPSPERLRKVERSMTRLDTIIAERETALRLLQTGQERPRPGDWRKDIFGRTYWYKYKEWPIPWYLNRRHMKRRFTALPFVDHYVRLMTEQRLRNGARRRKREKENAKKLQEKFPHLSEKVKIVSGES